MFRNVLVPVDFTPRSRRASGVAARLAAGSKGEVTLLHVIERIDSGAPRSFDGFYRKIEKSARRQLEGMRSDVVRKGIDCRAEVLYGRRVDEILRFAESRRTDLIVLSSHKLPLRRGEAWGTISYRVGLLARCPVLLVK
jgi:universal stress protein A